MIDIDSFRPNDDNKPYESQSIYRHVGAVIRSQRKKFKPRWTQEKLASRVGISRASLANIEIGRQSITLHQLYVFARALGLSPSDFLIPANDTGVRGDWDEIIPDNLDPQQKDQIARLLADTQVEPALQKEQSRAKQAKR